MKLASKITLCLIGMVLKDGTALQCLSNESKTKLQATKTSLNNLKTSIDTRIANYQKDMETKMKKLFDDMGSIQTDLKNKINKVVGEMESVVSGCQKNQWKEYKGHYYYFGIESLTWSKAEQRCKQIGGHLAKVDDAAEDKWIADNRPSLANYWIGLNDLKKEHEWRWSIDETITKYTHWYSTYGRRGRCCNCGAIQHRSYTWLDIQCWFPQSYVCESLFCN